jgi:hypothetical protein
MWAKLAVPFMSCFSVALMLANLACGGRALTLEEASILSGRDTPPPKFSCTDQCTLGTGACTGWNPPIQCGAGTLGQVCGWNIVTKISLLYCVVDPAGGLATCGNDGTGSCYSYKNCICQPAPGGKFVCDTDPRANAQNSANVTCSKKGCTGGAAQAGCN